MKKFPCGDYGNQKLTFFPAPCKSALRAFAVIVFAWIEDKVIVCDIEGRGWCVPSGRVEPGEDSCQAACRESREEAGIILDGLQYLGCYKVDGRGETRWVDCFCGRVSKLTEIETPEESRGRKAVHLCELPEIYHIWNELTAQVFAFSWEVLQRRDLVLGPCPCPVGEV